MSNIRPTRFARADGATRPDKTRWPRKLLGVWCVDNSMRLTGKILLLAACLVGCVAGVAKLARPAYGSDFTAFAEDEDVCRQAGAAAIKGATGPLAAQRYDVAYGRCMAAQGRMRMMDAYRNAAPPAAPYPVGPDNSDYPDAFYGIPYATPGYGYDGFSY